MDIQEYISSGIVESYVLGLASDEERKEFEQLCNQYPELLAARTSFEMALEKQAMENAIIPPAGLKGKILDQIGGTGKVVSMQPAPARKINWANYAAAASVILLAGSIYWNLTLSNKNKILQNNYNNTVAELSEVKKRYSNPDRKSECENGFDERIRCITTILCYCILGYYNA